MISDPWAPINFYNYLKNGPNAYLCVQSVSSSRAPLGGHVFPGDDDGQSGRYSAVSGKSLLDERTGPTQNLWAVVLPEINVALSVAVVQVSQQGGDHFETGRHLPQVLLLGRGLAEGHKSIRVDLKQKAVQINNVVWQSINAGY